MPFEESGRKTAPLYPDVLNLCGFLLDLLMAAAYPGWMVTKVIGTAGKKHWGGWGFAMCAFGYPLFVSAWAAGPESPTAADPWIEAAWMAMLAAYPCHWIATRLNRRVRHSRFLGKSWVQLVFPRAGLMTAALTDFGILWGLSLLAAPYSRMVADFLFFTGSCGLVTCVLFAHRYRRIVDRDRDRMIEGYIHAEMLQRY